MKPPSAFERLGTAAKLLIILSLAMLPIGGALMWSALKNLQSANKVVEEAVIAREGAAILAVDALIARNSLALRIAANAAIRAGKADACAEAARTLGIVPAIAREFEIEDENGTPLCAVGTFADIMQPPRTRAGDIKLWIAENEQSLLIRTGVEGGSATARLTRDELRAAIGSAGGALAAASLDDGRKRLDLVGDPSSAGFALGETHRIKVGGGRLEAMVLSPSQEISTAERLLILLPVLMWLVAALVTWLVVNRLLIRPLRRLQRAVGAFQPGDDPELLELIELGPAAEIYDLRDAFISAVGRIEETERGLADALEGQRRLVREVHHRVKNNLQVVASLLSIHGRSADSAEGKAAFSAIGRRVDALSVVHRNHYAELEDNQGIALRALLNELSSGLRASASEQQQGLPIVLDVDLASTTQDVAVAVAFLVTEIVEYALLRGDRAPIEITLRRTSPLTGRLTIASSALLDGIDDSPERRQFERIVEGLSRQLRSPLDRNLGRYSVDLPLFPDHG